MKKTLALSPWKQHYERWKNCTKCNLQYSRKSVVIARGNIPADIVFIGEAPGKSEDVIGQPFVGPAGKLLDEIIKRSTEGVDPLRMAFTNLVCCIPLDGDGNKISEPDYTEIKSCHPRLIEFVRICKPKMIVNVGKLSKSYVSGQSMFDPVDWIPEGEFISFVDLDHPAYLLRMNYAQQGLAIQRAIVKLRTSILELL